MGKPKLTVVPLLAKGTQGIGVAGTF
jgi:hypothetical protein